MNEPLACRFCLCTVDLLLIDNALEYEKYCDIVRKLCDIQIKTDGAPFHICKSCIDFLKHALSFIKLCNDADRKLKREHEIQANDCTSTVIDVLDDILKDENFTDGLIANDDFSTIVKDDSYDVINKLEHQVSFDTDQIDDGNFNDLVDIRPLINTNDDKNYQLDEIDTKQQPKLRNKKRRRSEDIKKRVNCKVCQKNLSVNSIDVHMVRCHPGADDRKEKCEICSIFVMKGKLNWHKEKSHGIENLKCEYCKEDFTNKEILSSHIKSCAAKKKRRRRCESSREILQCEICHKKMQKSSLRVHMAIKHAGLGPVCEHCGKKLGNKFRLNEHLRAKHGYEKFKCSCCDFQTASTSALKNHERRHRGEKPFVCEECGAKFHAAYLLTQHRQSHRAERVYKCNLCPASFKANNSLHMHKRTCHSNSLYKCWICARSYSCRHYAVKHIRHVHRFKGRVPELQALVNVVE